MKRIMIVAALFLLVTTQTALISVDCDKPTDDGRATGALTTDSRDAARQLGVDETKVLVGGDVSGCWTYVDEAGDTHGVCCLDLWIITLCAGVNVSAIERALPFL